MSSTEVAIRENGHAEPALAELLPYAQAPRDVVDGWVGMLVQVEHLANAIADTEFVPKELRGKPAAIAACFLTGRELGLGPMASLKHIQMVDGTPSMSAEYKRARVLERGHHYEILELTRLKCRIRGRRHGQQNWTEFEYTITDAKTARLVKPKGSWETRPKRMLLARASSDMCDAIFTDATNGLPTAELISEEYVNGEFNEEGGADMAAPAGTSEAKAPVRRRRRAKAPSPEPELDEPGQAEQPEQPEPADDPELQDEFWDDPEEDELFVEEETVPDEPMVEPGQVTRLQAQAKALRLNDEQRHRAASEITGRQIRSYTELTADEADQIIDAFAVAQRKPNPQQALKRIVAGIIRDREDGDDDLDGDD